MSARSAFAFPGAPGGGASDELTKSPGGPVPRALQEVGIEERLGQKIPGDVTFQDPQGRPVRLADRLGRGKPIVLTLVYYDCPMLCGQLLGGLTAGLRETGLLLGRDYEALTVSFNPRETSALASARQGHFLQALGRPEAREAWPFLVGQPQDIDRLAESVGFRYRWDAGTRQYAHVALAFVVAPDGTISRYLYGVRFPERDLRLALVEAGDGKVGTTVDRVLLKCFRWDPASRRYALFVSTYLRVGGLLVFLGLSTLLVTLVRRERRRGAGG
ncbi:MAG: SCO family protein [Deltaproteobacteria bacterium]|nr:SCO family protein [Deltaproteobacteria bacterium]